MLLAGGMTEKEINYLCCLSTFAWTIPAISAAPFRALVYLATTSWFKKCVMTKSEGRPYELRIFTSVTGTLFRMRNIFC